MVLSEPQGNGPAREVAIIGMGCKFPGADSVNDYWRILDEGLSMVQRPPEGRFPTEKHHRSSDKSVFLGNFIDDIDCFDNRFFKKSSREAASMDPQQRLLLEVAYRTLESSGYFGPDQQDTDVGCFVGVCASDYNDNVAGHPPNAFSTLGTLRAFLTGKISHFFGFTGPSVSVDTACSSSAVAIDAACKAILNGDCTSALAGGVSIFTSPHFYQNLAAASFLSPTGATKSFDAGADGYCRGEGVALVMLKEYSQAVEDGDQILATILSSSVKQSSNKTPITVPYSPSQTALYRRVLQKAGVAARDVTFLEAHGTGTPIGDPQEYLGIQEVFASEDREQPLYFASVKGNIGHTEGASGVAGLIKTVLMMQKQLIPRQASFAKLNPKIDLVPGRVEIPTRTIPWTAKTRIACVNNYGAAGSIAAMVVREPISSTTTMTPTEAQETTLSKYPIFISANSPKSLAENCRKLREQISQLHPSSSTNILADIAFNLSDKQNRGLPNTLIATVGSMAELDDQLRIAASNPESSPCVLSSPSPPLVLAFGGQTNRSIGLSHDVFSSSALLRKHLNRCDKLLRTLGNAGIYPGIFDPTPMDDVVALQCMQFALHYASAMCWIDCGLKVDYVIGHSFGQLVALTVAGVLSLLDGLKLVHGRAVLMRDMWGDERGLMIALDGDQENTMQLIASVRSQTGQTLSPEVACYNGPKSHVLVGSAADIGTVVEVLKQSTAIKHKVLNVTHGFHSRFCDPILPELKKLAEGLTFNKPMIPIETCSDDQSWTSTTPQLIADHTRTPVYFGAAVQRIAARLGPCTWLEAGSNSSITSMARRALSSTDSRDSVFLPINLSRDNAMGSLAETTASLWKRGHQVQFWPFHRTCRAAYQPMNLPPYQFEKTRHWLEFRQSEASKQPEKAPEPIVPEKEPVLITLVGFHGTSPPVATFTIDPRSEQWTKLVQGHSVLAQPLCPAPLYIELVLQAARDVAAAKGITAHPFARVEDLEITASLGIAHDKMISLILTQADHTGRSWNFAFHAADRNHQQNASSADPVHATGKVDIIAADDSSVPAEFARTGRLLQQHHGLDNNSLHPDGEVVQGLAIYQLFSRVVQYHDFYKGIRRITAHGDTAVARVSLPSGQPPATEKLCSSPVAVDNFLQVPGLFANCLAPCPGDEVYVCSKVDRIQVAAGFGGSMHNDWTVIATSTRVSEKEMQNDVFVTDRSTGELLMVVFGARFSRVRITSLTKVLARANDDVSNKATLPFTVSSETTPQAPTYVTKSIPSAPTTLSEAKVPAPRAPTSVEGPLRELLSKITDVKTDRFQGDITLEELGIDSLMATEIVSEVDQVFGVSIPQEDLQYLLTFSALRDYLDARGPRVAAGFSSGSSDSAIDISSDGHHRPSFANGASTAEKKAPGQTEDEEELVSRLAGLLSSHLECPTSTFQRTTNLANTGLDSLLCMELATDIQTTFGVTIDVSQLTTESTFHELVNMVVASGTPNLGSSSTLTSQAMTPEPATPALEKEDPWTNGSPDALLPDAQSAFESIKADFDPLADEYKFSGFYKNVYAKNAKLVLAYTIEAFADLGIDLSQLKPGDPIPELPCLPKHHNLKDVLYEVLRDGQVADYNGQHYVRSEMAIDATHSSILFKELVDAFPQHAKEHMLLNVCGSELAKLLSGAKDPLTLLFGSKANRDILEDVYSTGPMYVIMSQLLTSFLERTLSTATPGPSGKFRLIELGAGTGSTTKWVVDRLVKRGIPIEYTFTDISSSLVNAGKRKFAKYDCMKYATINIEKTPPAEYHGQFDVVLSTNCIHATSNLPNSLQNIRTLLRPNGFVSLVEFTTRMFWFDLVFGLLEGWWLFNDGRKYVLASPEFWEECMQNTGFKHVSWTGGSTRESQVVRIITGFVQPATDPNFRSIPQFTKGDIETVVFKHTDKRLPLRADIYLPSAEQAAKHDTWTVALLVHGGGHVMLSRKDVRPRQIQLLLDHGLLPVSVDYRLCPEINLLEGPITDVRDAYKWSRKTLPSLRLTSTNLQIDSSKAVAIGWSTGGTLAMSLAWTVQQDVEDNDDDDPVPPPDAILAFYCPTNYEDEFWKTPNIPKHSEPFTDRSYNILSAVHPSPITAYNVPPAMMAMSGWMAPQDPRSQLILHMNWRAQTLPVLFRGLPSQGDDDDDGDNIAQYHDLEQPSTEEIVRASPYAQIVRGTYRSPTHIVFGTEDDLIPWQQAMETVEALQAAGVEAGMTLIEGQPHLFDLFRDADGKRWEAIQPAYRFVFERVGR
ncbi:type I Iterative Polyketide synthase (PKS) [Aspergillus brasiliensis]|nr:type I Iterative Polyketide synthase (PKS) [Aspergillus brasiliensis]